MKVDIKFYMPLKKEEKLAFWQFEVPKDIVVKHWGNTLINPLAGDRLYISYLFLDDPIKLITKNIVLSTLEKRLVNLLLNPTYDYDNYSMVQSIDNVDIPENLILYLT